MADIAAPYLEPDGTHVIPITGIHRPGMKPNEDAVGEVRWSRRDGVTFRFSAPLTSIFIFDNPRPEERGGAGSVSAMSFDPEWVARTADGSPVCVYGTTERTTTNMTTGRDAVTGGRSSSSRCVEGTACYVEVGLHRDNPLTFWHATPTTPRLYSPGWTLRGWPVEEPNEYKIGDTTYTGSRCSLPLGGPNNQSLIAGGWQNARPGGVWLTYDSNDGAKPLWFPDSCDHIRGLMSVLLLRHVQFVWRDTPTSEERLTRLYYGWHKGVDPEHPRTQLVPVYGTVESLRRGQEVTNRLACLVARYAELRLLFDPGWVISTTAPFSR